MSLREQGAQAASAAFRAYVKDPDKDWRVDGGVFHAVADAVLTVVEPAIQQARVDAAEAVLDSSDPMVLKAMLGALRRAGLIEWSEV